MKTLKEKCDIMLLSLIGEENIDVWWKSKNKAFQMLTPEEVFNTDDEGKMKVFDYLFSYLQR